jgi:hypothetical protein
VRDDRHQVGEDDYGDDDDVSAALCVDGFGGWNVGCCREQLAGDADGSEDVESSECGE